MGMFRCARCDVLSDSKGGSCIPALDEKGADTWEFVHEECATPAELCAYLPGVYEDPNAPCECGEWKCDECRARVEREPMEEKPMIPRYTEVEREELAELRKDKMRLDWLWRNSGGTYKSSDEAWTVIYTLHVGPDDWPDDPRDVIDHMIRIER